MLAGDPNNFDWRAPRLRECGLEDLELARMVPKLVVNQTFLALLKRGEKVQQHAHIVSGKLLDMLRGIETACPFLSGAKAETMECAGSEAHTLSELGCVMGAKTGTRYLMKQAVLQSKVYKDTEAMLRRTSLAGRVLLPKMQEILSRIATSLENVKRLLMNFLNSKMP